MTQSKTTFTVMTESEREHHVMVRHNETPDWWFLLATFAEKDAALDYRDYQENAVDGAFAEGAECPWLGSAQHPAPASLTRPAIEKIMDFVARQQAALPVASAPRAPDDQRKLALTEAERRSILKAIEVGKPRTMVAADYGLTAGQLSDFLKRERRRARATPSADPVKIHQDPPKIGEPAAQAADRPAESEDAPGPTILNPAEPWDDVASEQVTDDVVVELAPAAPIAAPAPSPEAIVEATRKKFLDAIEAIQLPDPDNAEKVWIALSQIQAEGKTARTDDVVRRSGVPAGSITACLKKLDAQKVLAFPSILSAVMQLHPSVKMPSNRPTACTVNPSAAKPAPSNGKDALQHIVDWMGTREIDVETLPDGCYRINGKIRCKPEQLIEIANRERRKAKEPEYDANGNAP